MIYEPREDSLMLEKHVKKYAHGRALDVGTGSGIQAKAAMERTSDVLAVDIDPEAVKYARKLGIQAVVSDLFMNVKGTFDVIIFNPPYLPEEAGEDNDLRRQISGGKEGNELLMRFLKEAKNHLEEHGIILLVVSSLTKDAFKLFEQYNYKCSMLEEQGFDFETIYACLLSL